jgi:hypothetical protein
MEKQFLSILPQEKNVLEMRMKKITNKSKAFLRTLIQQVRNASEKARTTVFDYKLFNVSNRALQQIDELHHYPEDIRKIIFSKQHIAVVISFNIRGRDYHLYLFYPIASIPKATQIQEEIRKIYTWLEVVHEHANESCSQTMTMYIYMTNHKKVMPTSKTQELDRIHVNSAFTTACSESTVLNVFREEEWFKCFIHETFHNLGLDFSHSNNDSGDQYIHQLFHIMSDVRLYETYCEMWAEIIYLMFYTYRRQQTIEEHLLSFEEKLFIEQQFSLFQSAKILHHYNLNHYNQLMDKTTTILYRDKTPTFSYYILKSLFMYHMDEFLQWCIDTNRHSLQFSTNHSESILLYCQLIQKIHKNKHFVHSIMYAYNIVKTQNKKKNIMKTLRMTIQG